jgi:hypothetical protein
MFVPENQARQGIRPEAVLGTAKADDAGERRFAG